MSESRLDARSVAEFDKARIHAFFENVQALLTGRSNSVVPFEAIRKRLGAPAESYRGFMTVPVSAIVGSENRADDFSISFRPKKRSSEVRWSRIHNAFEQMKQLPPVVLYEVGNVYFIRDGNHRVSVAKRENAAYIDAEVYSLNTKVDFTPSMNINTMLTTIAAHEKKHFFKETGFSDTIKNQDLVFGREERFDLLARDIERHRRYLQGQQQEKERTFQEAAESWHRELFLPFAELAKKEDMVLKKERVYPPDLYIRWLEYEEEIEQEYSACAMPDDFFAEHQDFPT